MTDKRKKRIKEIAAELGIGHRAAANVLEQRFACSRAGHVWHTRIDGNICTNCGATAQSEGKAE